MFIRLILIFIWIVSVSLAPQPTPRPVFGLQVRFQMVTQMYTFVAFLDNGHGLTYKKILTTDDFVKIASGHWPSIYNPNRENLFEKNNVFCGMFQDSLMLHAVPYCFPVDSLWKLRYSEFPFRSMQAKGWAGRESRPSDRQIKYLQENYNVYNLDNEYFLDTNMWKILRDVRDSTWIQNYISLR